MIQSVDKSLMTTAEKKYLFNAFISYSNTPHDSIVAKAVQKGLHRFAKPFWKMRAIRVFRDETNISANPDLLESLKAAILASEFFILIASPQAKISKWVSQEVDFWIRNNGTDKLIIVIADGSVSWDAKIKSYDGKTSCFPAVLSSNLLEESFFIDLRQVPHDQMTMRNPAFADRIAAISATIRNIPKDEITGEDVKFRRVTRLAVGVAFSMLLILAVALSISTVYAFKQRNVALRNNALFLAEGSRTALNGGDTAAALVLGLKSVQEQEFLPQKDLVPAAYQAVARASAANHIVASAEALEDAYALSSDSNVVVRTTSRGNALGLFDINTGYTSPDIIKNGIRIRELKISYEKNFIFVVDEKNDLYTGRPGAALKRAFPEDDGFYRPVVLNEGRIILFSRQNTCGRIFVASEISNEIILSKTDMVLPKNDFCKFTADDSFFFSADNLYIFRTKDEKKIYVYKIHDLKLELSRTIQMPGAESVEWVIEDRVDNVLAVSSEGSSLNLDKKDGRILNLPSINANFLSASVSLDGQSAALIDTDGSRMVAYRGNVIARIAKSDLKQMQPVMSPDGSAAFFGNENGSLFLWSVNNPSQISPIGSHGSILENMYLRGDGKLITIGGGNIRVFTADSYASRTMLTTKKHHADSYMSIIPEGITYIYEAGTITIYYQPTGEKIGSVDLDPSVPFSDYEWHPTVRGIMAFGALQNIIYSDFVSASRKMLDLSDSNVLVSGVDNGTDSALIVYMDGSIKRWDPAAEKLESLGLCQYLADLDDGDRKGLYVSVHPAVGKALIFNKSELVSCNYKDQSSARIQGVSAEHISLLLGGNRSEKAIIVQKAMVSEIRLVGELGRQYWIIDLKNDSLSKAPLSHVGGVLASAISEDGKKLALLVSGHDPSSDQGPYEEKRLLPMVNLGETSRIIVYNLELGLVTVDLNTWMEGLDKISIYSNKNVVATNTNDGSRISASIPKSGQLMVEEALNHITYEVGSAIRTRYGLDN